MNPQTYLETNKRFNLKVHKIFKGFQITQVTFCNTLYSVVQQKEYHDKRQLKIERISLWFTFPIDFIR